MLLRRCALHAPLFTGCCICLLSARLFAQTAVPDASGHLVFKANARTVIVDVVVTGRDGKAVQGLHQQDFEVAEDGHPQQVTFFEEHKSPPQGPASLPDLPPNIFTNIPRVKPVDSVSVLLLDSLNTPLSDQSVVHAQILHYLQGVRPGRRIAIFTLGNQLRYIQGFTADPAVLMAALNKLKSGAGPQTSPLLKTNSQETAEQAALAQIAEAEEASPSVAFQRALQRLQQYTAEQQSVRTDQRVELTLDAFQQLGRYLAGIPGRKNVIWFSGSFPVDLLPNPELADSFAVERNYSEKVRTTDSLLAAAEVAIYPVSATGLQTDSYYGAEQQYTGYTVAPQPGQPQEPIVQPLQEQALHSQINHMQTDSLERNADQTSMEQIAKETGGQAFYNTNGLDDALDRVADHGAYFYTVAFTPTNAAADGKFRKLQLKLVKQNSLGESDSGYKLAYRRGYYAAGARVAQTTVVKADSDPLHPFMGPGMPESTQILYAIRVKLGGNLETMAGSPEIVNHPTPVTNSFGRVQMANHNELAPGVDTGEVIHAGDNPKLKGKLTRYSVDFVIAARGLELDSSAGGGRHGSLESTLVVYDRDGKPLNWLVRKIDLDMDASHYAQVQQNGVNFHLEIDVPRGGVSLRSGLYDNQSNLTGTLEVPLESVLVGQSPGLKAR